MFGNLFISSFCAVYLGQGCRGSLLPSKLTVFGRVGRPFFFLAGYVAARKAVVHLCTFGESLTSEACPTCAESVSCFLPPLFLLLCIVLEHQGQQ